MNFPVQYFCFSPIESKRNLKCDSSLVNLLFQSEKQNHVLPKIKSFHLKIVFICHSSFYNFSSIVWWPGLKSSVYQEAAHRHKHKSVLIVLWHSGITESDLPWIKCLEWKFIEKSTGVQHFLSETKRFLPISYSPTLKKRKVKTFLYTKSRGEIPCLITR